MQSKATECGEGTKRVAYLAILFYIRGVSLIEQKRWELIGQLAQGV